MFGLGETLKGCVYLVVLQTLEIMLLDPREKVIGKPRECLVKETLGLLED